MKNKIELKKAVYISIIVFLILNSIFIAINYIEYRKYTESFNKKINLIISNVKERYPESDVNELIKMLNNKEVQDINVLRNYGIDIKRDSAILENDKYFKNFLSLEIFMFFMLFILLGLTFLNYNRKKDKKLKEITQYIEEINRRNYKLDIEDNTEDELSILKNEVYKTTVMLKEVAENSVQDKVKLKDSLSDISHQLKTPLTSITIMLDNMLENKQMDSKTREDFIKDIKRAVININFLVNSLLKLSKFDTNTIKFINKDEDIGKIIKEAAKNIEGLCDLRNVKLNIIGEEGQTVYCDFKWQAEAITNILKNSVEHSYENSKIDINYSKNNMYTKIEIKDYGIRNRQRRYKTYI